MKLFRSRHHLGILLAFGATAWGQPPLISLKQVPIPQPTNLTTYVKDQQALVVLGKALFWDAQVGSDAKTACASCHFHAGADHRVKNILAPPASNPTTVVANQTVTSSMFPFHQLSNVGSNASTVVKDTRQVAGSAGVLLRTFLGLQPSNPSENGSDIVGSSSSLGGLNVRQVGNRNAPSVINAVYNVRNFWDGRASRLFTGQTPFGTADTGLNAVAWRNSQFVREPVAINNASLASQAVGPPLNTAEMSYTGRAWSLLGRKMLGVAPLSGQLVAADDSVLGAMANTSGSGLKPAFSYSALIQAAFQPAYWSGTALVDGQFTQMESNFPLFWGLAIQAYESTLVSDNSRLDQFLEGNTGALSALEQQGLQVFGRGRSQCTQCHQGSEFTAASFTNSANTAATNTDPDNIGFFRTGVSPITDDTGLGGLNGFGQPLFPPSPTRANGTFKSPGLRNVEFTGPYFHDGGQATLEQVMQFYARNGDFPAGGNLGPGIGNINLSQADQSSLVAFLNALSDDRVRYERAPFDHPSLCISTGAQDLSPGLLVADNSDARFRASAAETTALIPAVGRSGNASPLQTFAELLAGIGSDGSRAHSLTEACSAAAALSPQIDAVTNAATFATGPVSPGEIVSIFGSNLSGSVTFDGMAATTVYASPTQVNVTIPYTVAGSTATLRMGTAALQLPVVPASPGIFAAVASASGTLTLYATGGGALSKDALPLLLLNATVTVNGTPAKVLYAGIAPGLVEGANQVNVQLPAGIGSGALNIVLTVGGSSCRPFFYTSPLLP
ncbi:MAG: cytochrome c peroxidase [Bryobacteraceae bacterium]